MYAQRTVFVIGAGCSSEFGLPLGTTLVDRIYAVTSNADVDGFRVVRDAHLRSGIPGCNEDIDVRMTRFAKGVHGRPSIDQYLDFHKEDQLFVSIGKLAIAYVILHGERLSDLNSETLIKGLQSIKGTWITKLFHSLIDGTTPNTATSIFKNVSFISFNYDRCIEVGLSNLVRLATGMGRESLSPVMKRLKVTHPYGSLGTPDYDDWSSNMPTSGFQSRPVDPLEVLEAAKSLRTFTEGMDDEKADGEIKAQLSDADRIVYLGFSFLEQNMKLLTARSNNSNSRIYATAYGLSVQDVELAHNSIALASPVLGDTHRSRMTSVTMLALRASDTFDAWGNTFKR